MSADTIIKILERNGPLQSESGRDGVNAYAVLDEDRIISGGDDKRIRIWNWNNGEEQQQLWAESHYDITCLRVSHNKKYLASGHGTSGGVHLWSLESGELLWAEDDLSNIYDVAFSADDSSVTVLQGADHALTFKVSDGKFMHRIGDRYKSSVALLSNDALYGFTMDSGSLRSFNCRDGKERWSIPIKAKFALAISADDSMLAVLDENKQIHLVRCEDGAIGTSIVPDPQTQDNYAGKVLAFSPDGNTLAYVFSEQYLTFWNVSDGRLIAEHKFEKSTNYKCFQFLADGKRFVLGDWHGTNLLGEFHVEASADKTEIQWQQQIRSQFDNFVAEFDLKKSDDYWVSETFNQFIEQADTAALLPYVELLIDLDSERGGTPIDLLDKLLTKIKSADAHHPVIKDIAIEMLRLGSLSAGAALHDAWGMKVSFTEQAATQLAEMDLSSLSPAQMEKLIRCFKQAVNFAIELSQIDVTIHALVETIDQYLQANDSEAYKEVLPYIEDYRKTVTEKE